MRIRVIVSIRHHPSPSTIMTNTSSHSFTIVTSDWLRRAPDLWPGVLLSAVIAIAATFIAEHQGGPPLLYALLLGMALHPPSQETKAGAGIQFASGTVLRVGVALLGARITIAQLFGLGWTNGALIVFGIVSTIGLGFFLSRVLGLDRRIGVLTGGATAICGASAAIAIAAVLPRDERSERELTFTIAGITALSTGAMIVYPVISGVLGLSTAQAGIFLGGTIHDVAQVVGAGYSVSSPAGDMAVLTKMLRVALLLPCVLIIAFAVRRRVQESATVARGPLIPLFLIVFAVFVAINSLGWVTAPVAGVVNNVSRACLVTAIAAVGLKTSLLDMKKVGAKALALLCIETVFLATLVLVAQLLGK
jgi:uncharacterized integral membrane protein (TIGR00698 family)